MNVPKDLSFEWHALAELVTAAVLVAVVYPTSQSIYRRYTRPVDTSSISTPDYAYAASAVVRPGETSTLRYGDESQSTPGSSNSIPTILRKFQELSLSDNETTGNSHSNNSPASSKAMSPPSLRTTRSTFNEAGKATLARSQSVRFEGPPIGSLESLAALPSISSPGGDLNGVWSPLLPPPFSPPVQNTQSCAAPPSAGQPIRSATVTLPDTSTNIPATAPLVKGKGKGKQKAQGQQPASLRAASTPPSAPPTTRPTTRSMSVGPNAIASGSGSTGVATEVDIPPAESYIRRSTKRASWFESSSDTLLAHPPDFSSRNDVQLDDIFIHKGKDTYQMWIWEKAKGGPADWKRVWIGYIRASDRKALSVTPTRKEPSWVSEKWGLKTAKKRALLA